MSYSLHSKTGMLLRHMIEIMITLVVFGVITSAQVRPESKEVTFSGQNLILSGTLLIPNGQKQKVPGVVIVGEAGTTTRDAIEVEAVKYSVYRDLAESLAAQGVASLRFDRRCRGASGCRKIETYDDYIDDLRGAISFFAAQPAIDSRRIVLIGHGEGAFLASSLIAQIDDVAAGLVVVAMSGRNLGKLIRDKFKARMEEQGRSAEEVRQVILKAERVTRPLFFNQADSVKEKFDPRDPYDAELMALLAESPRTVSLMVNDPLQVLAAVRIPVLILQGGKDLEITSKDASFLEESLNRIYHPDHTLRILPDMDHLLTNNPGKPSFASYLDGNRTLDPKLISETFNWISQRFAASSKSGGQNSSKK